MHYLNNFILKIHHIQSPTEENANSTIVLQNKKKKEKKQQKNNCTIMQRTYNGEAVYEITTDTAE